MGAAAFFFVVRRPFNVPVGSRRVDGHHNICEGNGFLIDVYRPAVLSSLFVWPKNMVDQVFFCYFLLFATARPPFYRYCHFLIAFSFLSSRIVFQSSSNRYRVFPLFALSFIYFEFGFGHPKMEDLIGGFPPRLTLGHFCYCWPVSLRVRARYYVRGTTYAPTHYRLR